MRLTRNSLLRFFLNAGVFCFCAGFHTAHGGTTFVPPAENQWLRAAAELAAEMREATSDDRFARLFSSDSNILEYIRGIGAADYDKLQKVTVAEIPRRELTASLLDRTFAASDMDTAEYSRIAKVISCRINPAVVVSAVNGQEGSIHLAACAILVDSRTYIQPQDWREDLLLVLEYGGEYAVAVTFWKSGDDTVTGQAVFIRAERVETLLRSLNDYCGRPVSVKILTGAGLKGVSV